jgi:putative acetyltransferase
MNVRFYAVRQMEEARMSIRPATEDDLFALASLMYESFLEYKSSYTDEAFAATTPTTDQLASRMSEGPIWIGLQGGVIVGTVSLVPRGEELYVRGMAVLPRARGLRLGELLLKEAESFALAHEFRRLVLSTTPFLTRAIRLYERLGFRRTTEGPHQLFGTPLFTMVKDLSTS